MHGCASMHQLVNVTSKRGLREKEVFWEDVNICLKSFETERKLVMMEDMKTLS